MTKEYKLRYVIGTEIDMYTNLLQENMVTDKETRNFICRTVIPRFNKLRAILADCDDEECLFKKEEEPDC